MPTSQLTIAGPLSEETRRGKRNLRSFDMSEQSDREHFLSTKCDKTNGLR